MSERRINIPSDNPHDYCRLCFKDCNLVSLFPSGAEPQSFLLDQISQCTGIQLNSSEDVSCSICWRCAVALEDFHLFRQRSLQHDAVIREKYAASFEVRFVEEEQDDVEWVSTTLATDNSSTSQHNGEGDLDGTNMHQADFASTSDPDFEIPVIESVPNQSNVLPRAFTCHVYTCRREFSTEPLLYAHIEEQHANQTRPYKCTLCPAGFMRKNHLDRHVASHGSEPRLECKDCGARFLKPVLLIRHRQQYHAASVVFKTKSSKTTAIFKCKFCPKAFRHRSSLNLHVKSHYDILPCICEICGARFENDKGKDIHKGMFHSAVSSYRKNPPLNKPFFRCVHCARIFKHQKYLNQHIRYMHPTSWPANKQQETVAVKQQQTQEEDDAEFVDYEITMKTEEDDNNLLETIGIDF